MGNLYKKFATVFLLLTLVVGMSDSAKACDRSRLLLDSVSAGPGGTFNIHLQLCVGGGLLGLDKGADGQTGRFLFSFSASCPGFTVNTFTNPVCSDTIGICYPGVNVGPQPAFNATQAIFFNNSANWYACITSTVACGRPHTDCKPMVFNVSCLPDSIRIYGIEGGDNLFGGCYPNFTMLIDFTNLPVTWANIEALQEDGGVGLDWTTISETDNALFEVMRSPDAVEYEVIGSVQPMPQGNTKAGDYEFFDPNPLPGINYYQIRQVDTDGASSTSKTVAVNYLPPAGLAWRQVGPVPSSDYINMVFQTDRNESFTFEVFDLNGRKLHHLNFDARVGVNELSLDVRSFPKGVYYMRIRNNRGLLEKKIVVA